MKLILLSVVLCVSSLASANGKAGDVFFTKTLKKQICVEAKSSFWRDGVTAENCIASRFIFVEDKVQIKLEGTKKPLTTQMHLSFEIEGITFEVTLSANLVVSKTGGIKRIGWLVESILPEGYSGAALLKKTWVGVETKVEDIPKKIFAKMLMEVNNYISESVEYSHKADFEVPDFKIEGWENLLDPETKDLIGYLYRGMVASEEADLREKITLKFNLKGKYIDISVEGWNYYE